MLWGILRLRLRMTEWEVQNDKRVPQDDKGTVPGDSSPAAQDDEGEAQNDNA